MSEKVIGYLLVFLGIVIMVYAVFSVYSVFTARSKPINLLKLPAISLDFSGFLGGEIPEEQQDVMAQEGGLKTDLISADMVNQPLNFVFHLLFMGFLLNVGYKVASLGVQFVRPIKVKLKGKLEQEVQSVKT